MEKRRAPLTQFSYRRPCRLKASRGLSDSMFSFAHSSRPKTIDEVSSQQHAVNVLRRSLSSANVRDNLSYPSSHICCFTDHQARERRR